eukprot:gnl/Hemi2/17116_TR5695_c0_g1_i1.p1 gnl/Hemi2/17116_TR5695_c0_g1~~gnl/Hemi2/17116_TR5695_c0_g1_i1.p1  ORF type:complete len:478 (-),score=115.77 gnl/Hemi2/17116_TR5695_c0_g1_i1:86-1519(-)
MSASTAPSAVQPASTAPSAPSQLKGGGVGVGCEKSRIQVLYACHCGRRFDLQNLYFCVDCNKPTCSFCVSEEIDSWFCPTCLENMPSAEAMLFLNRCSKCFECPTCQHTLSTVSGVTDKASYLACGFCRWDSLHLGLKMEKADKLILNTIKRERGLPTEKAAVLLAEQYQKKASELQRQRQFSMRTRFSFTLALPQAQMQLQRRSVEELEASLKQKTALWSNGRSTAAPVPPDPLPQALLAAFDINDVTTLEQRLNSAGDQTSDMSQLYPRRKHLLTKRSRRCRACEHFVIKPDINPSVTSFRIQYVALHYMPRLSVSSITGVGGSGLHCGISSRVVITFANPVSHQMRVTLSTLTEPNPQWEPCSAQVTLPDRAFSIASFNDIAEYDDQWGDAENQALRTADVPTVIAERKFNKASVILHVIPRRPVGDVLFHLQLATQYADDSGTEHALAFPVTLNLGPVRSQPPAQHKLHKFQL